MLNALILSNYHVAPMGWFILTHGVPLASTVLA